jgi:hypothetical protein
MSFFETTPSGRILNRFSRYVFPLDEEYFLTQVRRYCGCSQWLAHWLLLMPTYARVAQYGPFN